ncbi:hypothetical protein B0H19DRAFT_1085416 [Mycena capillaripes]|nr:hypothetical protein B0H19DRAFT_1085416 [Mycena capillaripes]
MPPPQCLADPALITHQDCIKSQWEGVGEEFCSQELTFGRVLVADWLINSRAEHHPGLQLSPERLSALFKMKNYALGERQAEASTIMADDAGRGHHQRDSACAMLRMDSQTQSGRLGEIWQSKVARTRRCKSTAEEAASLI